MYKKMALCAARHSIPAAVDGSIFGQEVNPLDLQGQAAIAADSLAGVTRLDLYVTGLTVALVTVINHCRQSGVELTLYHFDRQSGDYYPQPVI
jgi:hypothetical protein